MATRPQQAYPWLQFALRFALIWGPLSLLLAAVVWVLFKVQVDAAGASIRNSERHVLALASNTVSTELSILRGDTLYLASVSSLRAWLDSGSAAAHAHLSADFLAFARDRGIYDQVRFLNAQGREVVRVNWNRGKPVEVPSKALQAKAGRYYVRDTLALPAGHVYVSPFDLNVEHHAVQRPFKPMIRLGTPVFGPDGRKRGLVVLNYMGQRLLDQLRVIHGPNGEDVWLLNGRGDWLLGPQPKLEWGFMFPGRHNARFSSDHPAAWRHIDSGPAQGQFVLDGDLYTYSRLPLSKIFGTDVGTRHWVLVSRVSHAALAADVAAYARGLGTVFGVAVLLLAVAAALIAYYGTRRRQSELAVRASESLFRGLLDAAPDAFVIVDASGCITMVNEQTERWFGYDRDELIGQSVEMLVPERYREPHVGYRAGYLTEPKLRSMGAGLDLYALRKDASEFPVEISLSPLRTGKENLVIGIVRDIAARKRIEEMRRVAETQYRELVESLPIGIYRNSLSGNGHFLDVNPAMVDMFEAKSANELREYRVKDLCCDVEAASALADNLVKEGSVRGHELRVRTLRGREFDVSISAVLKKDPSGRTYLDGIAEDITARKQSEAHIHSLNQALRDRATELEAVNTELESFSYSVSHDLRAPLRSMDGFSRILLDEYAERLDDKGRDRLGRIRAATQRMGVLIDDLLKLSRVSRVELHREAVDVSTMARDVVQELRKDEPDRDVEFSAQEGLMEAADARLLRVVLDNLLGNAWKYTGKTEGAGVEFGAYTEDGVQVFYVRDNGAGFDMTYAGKLFSAFQRLHDAGEFPGTGIGLATVQRIIRKHGGRVWAEGEVGRGASFYFTLQRAEAT
ncbi:MAG: PAS domain S-box protein [Acidihalobacter sp.]|uniref:sensor histidine kinase n=1 Tax=Acidihalobacter sp. TaxID=1872108 RepID=UPI00307E2F83